VIKSVNDVGKELISRRRHLLIVASMLLICSELSGCSGRSSDNDPIRATVEALGPVGKSTQELIAVLGPPSSSTIITGRTDDALTVLIYKRPGLLGSLDLGWFFYIDTNGIVTTYWDGRSD
jgi:hypothetical protein